MGHLKSNTTKKRTGRQFYSPDFGKRLRELILKHYDSPTQFSLVNGFHEADVWRWLHGRCPTIENVYRLSILLKVSPAMLCWGKDGGRRYLPLSARVRSQLELA